MLSLIIIIFILLSSYPVTINHITYENDTSVLSNGQYSKPHLHSTHRNHYNFGFRI